MPLPLPNELFEAIEENPAVADAIMKALALTLSCVARDKEAIVLELSTISKQQFSVVLAIAEGLQTRHLQRSDPSGQ